MLLDTLSLTQIRPEDEALRAGARLFRRGAVGVPTELRGGSWRGFALRINEKTATASDVTIPKSMLVQADEVIK